MKIIRHGTWESFTKYTPVVNLLRPKARFSFNIMSHLNEPQSLGYISETINSTKMGMESKKFAI